MISKLGGEVVFELADAEDVLCSGSETAACELVEDEIVLHVVEELAAEKLMFSADDELTEENFAPSVDDVLTAEVLVLSAADEYGAEVLSLSPDEELFVKGLIFLEEFSEVFSHPEKRIAPHITTEESRSDVILFTQFLTISSVSFKKVLLF